MQSNIDEVIMNLSFLLEVKFGFRLMIIIQKLDSGIQTVRICRKEYTVFPYSDTSK